MAKFHETPLGISVNVLWIRPNSCPLRLLVESAIGRGRNLKDNPPPHPVELILAVAASAGQGTPLYCLRPGVWMERFIFLSARVIASVSREFCNMAPGTLQVSC